MSKSIRKISKVNFSSCTLREGRGELGMTQQEMADSLGVSRNYVCMIETGIKPFSEKLRKRLVSLSEQRSELYGNHAAANGGANLSEKKERGPYLTDHEKKSEGIPAQGATCPSCAVKDSEIAWLRQTITALQKNFAAVLASIENGAKKKE